MNINLENPFVRSISSLARQDIEKGYEVSFEMQFPGASRAQVPVFVKEEFALDLYIEQITDAIGHLKTEGVNVSPHFPSFENDHLRVYGLLGCDIIRVLPQFELVDCLNGKAFKIASGLIPIGDVNHFLPWNLIKPVESGNVLVTSNSPVETAYSDFTEAVDPEIAGAVNFVLNPRKSYFSPLSIVSDDSAVDQGLENMFNLESLGIKDTTKMSSYDEEQIDKFKRGISLKDNVYSVKLPWHEDIISQVPASYQISVAIAFNITDRLGKQGKLTEYHDVFKKQLEEGIIERIPDIPPNGEGHIWIPHRPVFKTEGESTTKIRPVFNCSLKRGDKPSLNEAAYSGIDLMSGLLDLLIKFRSNDFFLLADIKQAFLQIKLSEVEDRNRFSFLLVENGR